MGKYLNFTKKSEIDNILSPLDKVPKTILDLKVGETVGTAYNNTIVVMINKPAKKMVVYDENTKRYSCLI
jgi:hypothetical protein